jgi:hypothetical protein
MVHGGGRHLVTRETAAKACRGKNISDLQRVLSSEFPQMPMTYALDGTSQSDQYYGQTS